MPAFSDRMIVLVAPIAAVSQSQRESHMSTLEFQGLIGEAPSFRRLLHTARLVANTDVSLLLIGEAGTGKESLGREIHRLGVRRDRSFVLLPVAGLSADDLVTALNEAFANASGGSLFIDEVAELPPPGQARLLYWLAGPGGGVRIMAATRHDLWERVRSGAFREDLYYRLCVVPLELPSLRERVQDIGLLLDHFLALAAATYGLPTPRFSLTAHRQLRRYAWPGNARELRNFCERMVILRPGEDLGPENLPWEIRQGEMAGAEAPVFKLPASGIDLQVLEVDFIRQALALAGGNKSRAARLLGLTRDTLLYRLEKYLIKA
jgi:DNA-binding NtrC family response regulator